MLMCLFGMLHLRLATNVHRSNLHRSRYCSNEARRNSQGTPEASGAVVIRLSGGPRWWGIALGLNCLGLISYSYCVKHRNRDETR